MNTKTKNNKPIVEYDGATNFAAHRIGDVSFMFHYENGVRMVQVSFFEGQNIRDEQSLTEEQFAALYYSIKNYISRENKDLVEGKDFYVFMEGFDISTKQGNK